MPTQLGIGQTVTVQMIRDAVADTINSPNDNAACPGDYPVWSESIGVCKGTWLATPSKDDLEKGVCIGVIALARRRGGKIEADNVPERGRIARGLIASVHSIRIVTQARVPTNPADRDARADEIAEFVQQIQDYWTAKHRKLKFTGILENGNAVESQAIAYPASPVRFDVQALDTDSILAAVMDFDFWLAEKW